MAVLKSIKMLSGGIAVLCASLLLTGCTTEYPLEVNVPPVLCLNSLITAGEPIEVEVTRTWIYTDMEATEDHGVTDATVTGYANGIPVAEDYLPSEGDEIRIHAFSRLYGEAEATVTVPQSPVLKDFEQTAAINRCSGYEGEDGIFRIEMQFNHRLLIAIEDMPEVENYYLYDMEPHGVAKDIPQEDGRDERAEDSEDEEGENHLFLSLGNGSLDYDAEPIFGEHISEFDEVQGATPYGFSFFTDRQFSGKDYRLNLRYTNAQAIFRGFPEDVEEFGDASGFEILLSATSESYYKWNLYCWHFERGSLFEFVDSGLTDPVAAYSNVSTGAGVVAARAVTRVRIPP